jgi:hypothetical protein
LELHGASHSIHKIKGYLIKIIMKANVESLCSTPGIQKEKREGAIGLAVFSFPEAP